MAEFLAAGTVLSSGRNNYVVQSVLGSGGFGITYKATVSTTFNGMPAVVTVAVKEHFLKNDCERDSTTMSVNCSQPARERVERSRRDFAGEARRLMSVAPGQPNIVQVSEVFDANNTSYYVMEYLDGMTLQDYVRQRGVITEQEMRGIMLPIVRAVGHLHRNRITHLDIKPTNIMLTKGADGRIRPVLIDFGLSKHYNADGAATSTINIQGFSDGYAPVEQYGGITSFSPASDVYSLAATMMFCLLGRALPKSMTLMSEDVRRLIPCNVSPQLQSVLTASLYMESRRRPADADAMLRMLTSAGAVTPTAPSAVHTTPYRPAQPTHTIGSTQTSRHTQMSRPATTVRRPQPAAPSGRSRSVVRGLLVAAIALVALIGYVLFVPASDEPTAPESTELPEETEDPDYVDEPEATAQPAAEPDRSGKDAKVIHNRPARQLQKNGIRVPRNSVPGTTVPENIGKNLRDVDKDAKGKGSLKESERKSVTDDVQQGKSNHSKGSHEEPQSATVTTNISSQV